MSCSGDQQDRPVGYDARVFEAIVAAFDADAGHYGFASRVAIPMSARYGDNVGALSPHVRIGGPTLIEHSETVEPSSGTAASKPLRFPVQWVNRPDLTFRGYAGTLASGRLRPGDPIVVARSGQEARIERTSRATATLPRRWPRMRWTLTLDREIDVSRGDILGVPPDARPEVSDQVAAHLIWMAEAPCCRAAPIS